MEKAIAYIRVSDQRQADDGSSLSTQEKQVFTYAQSKGYEFHKLFREEGESAKTDLRPQLQELLRFCQDKSRGIRVLIVPKIDRLARNAFDYASIKLALQRVGVRIESVGEKIEDSPVGRFTETIMASVAQFDNEIRSERCKGGMIEAVSQGRWVWQAPRGYRNVRFNGKGTIEPHPTEAALIKKAFGMLADGGQSPVRVRQWLETSGLKMSRTQFYRLMENPVYVGKIRAFGGEYEARPPFIPLVTQDLFYRARHALRSRTFPAKIQPNNADFPLRGTIKCTCGAFMTAHWARGRTGKYPYYRCMRCSNSNLRAGKVADDFEVELGCYQVSPDLWDRIRQSIDRQSTEDRGNTQDTRESSEKKIQALVELQKAISLKNAKGVVPDDIAKEQIEELAVQIAEIRAAQPIVTSRQHVQTALEFADDILRDPTYFWNVEGIQTKKDLLRYMYPQGVTYDRNKGFQTADYELLEQVKAAFGKTDSGLVVHEPTISKPVLDWIVGLAKKLSKARESTDAQVSLS